MLRSIKACYLATATGGCFAFFWSGSLFLSWVVLPLVRLLLARSSEFVKIRACQDIVGLGFRLFLGSMRWTRTLVFHPRRARLVLPESPCVLVANHPTLIDVAAIIAVHPRVCCVAKSDLFESVLVGRLLRFCGHINGGRERSISDGLSVILQATKRLQEGHSVLIFPEGTRSPTHGLRRFKPGAFEICRRAEVPAVPILVSCDPPTLLKGLAWYALPRKTARYEIQQLSTLSKDALSRDSHQTARDVQGLYQKHIDALAGKSTGGTDSRSSRIPLAEDVNHARS